MENKALFDLAAAIQKWHGESVNAGLSVAELAELQAHLEDSVHDLESHGLSSEEAFWLARRRIGPGNQLAEEFERADPGRRWMDRLFWGSAMLLLLHLWTGVVSGSMYSVITRFIMGIGFGSFGQVLWQFWTLLPLAIAAYVLSRSGSVGFVTRLSRLVPDAKRLTVILATLTGMLFGTQAITWWKLSLESSSIHDGVVGRMDFLGTLLANLVWPGAALLLMVAALRYQRSAVTV